MADAVCDGRIRIQTRPGQDPALTSNSTASPSQPKILCFVNTHEKNHNTKVKAVIQTWGPRCDKLVFASSKTDASIGAIRIPNVNYTYEHLWGKHRETLRTVFEMYGDEYDWFYKADDDTYTIVENLRAYLASPEIKEQNDRGIPLHIGNPVAMFIDENGLHDGKRGIRESIFANYLEKADYKFIFNVGGAGYVMNHAFLKKLMNWLDEPECAPTRSHSTLLDDSMLSVCSAAFGGFPYLNTRDSLGRERFHQESPSTLYTLTPEDELYQDYQGGKNHTGGFQSGEDCCSSSSISFHHMNPSQMLAAHNLLHLCRGNNFLPMKSKHNDLAPSDTKIKLVGNRPDILDFVHPAKVLENAATWPPKATVLRIADEDNHIVVAIVNCGMLDFADNLVGSLTRFGASNFVLVPRDQAAYQVLLQVYPDNLVPPMPDSAFAVSETMVYGSKEFNDFNSVRPRIILEFLKIGVSVFYTDVDVVWKSHVLNLAETELQNSRSTAIFFEDNGPDFHQFSSGMMYLKPTEENKALLTEWERNCELREERVVGKRNDQTSFNLAIKKMHSRLSFQSFNATHLFPSGTEYFDDWNQTMKDKAKAVHNNWIKAKWRKRLRFEKEQLWQPTGRLDRNSYDCKTFMVKESKYTHLPMVDPSVVQPPVFKTETLACSIPQKKNRTLVVLLGGVRGGEATWESLYRNLLDPNNCDLALVLGASEKHFSSLYQRAKYIWDFPEHGNWGKAIDDMFGTSPEDKPSWREIAKATSPSGPFSGTEEDPYGRGVVNGLARLRLLEKLTALDLLDKYDRFVITRTDQYYPCRMNLDSLDASNIWVPTGEDWRGICDRFVLVSKDHVTAVLDVLKAAIVHPERYSSFSSNIESFIKLRWQENGVFDHVRRFRRTMFTAYTPDDESTWEVERHPALVIEGQTLIEYKYEDEYYQAMTSCMTAGHGKTRNIL